MGREVSIKVGLHAGGVKTGAEEVKHQLDDMKKHGEAAHKAAAGHGGKHGHKHEFGSMMGEMKVEKNVARLGQDLANATNGSEMLAVGLERVGKIFHLGIGLGVAAHLAGFFIEKNEKVIELYEKMTEAAEEFAAASKNAVLSGGFAENLAALEKGIKMLADIKKTEALDSANGSGLRRFVSGDFLVQGKAHRALEARKAKFETDESMKENAEAALEDLNTTAEIAKLKAEGHESEAAALERERKLKRDIAQVERSKLGEHEKAEAIEALQAAAEAADSAEELAAARERQAEAAKELAEADHKHSELLGEIARLGETEEQRMERLVEETSRLAKETAFIEELMSKGRASDGDDIARMRNKLQIAKNMKQLAEDAAKVNAKNHAEAIKDDIELANVAEANAEKLRKHALDGLTDEQKIAELLKERVKLAQQYRDADAAGDHLTAEKLKGKVIDINAEMDAAARNSSKAVHPEIIGDHFTRSGLGGRAFAVKQSDPAERAARAAEEAARTNKEARDLLKRIEDGLKNPRWKP